MIERLEQALAKIGNAIVADGGNVELVKVKDGMVKVRLIGACVGCPMSQLTLKMGIERHLKKGRSNKSVPKKIKD